MNEVERDKTYTTPEDSDAIFQRFVDYVSEWKKVIPSLRAWSFSFHIKHDKLSDDCPGTYDAKTGVRINTWPKYEDAVIEVFLPDGVEWIEEEIEEIIVHELMHALISPLMEAVDVIGARQSDKIHTLIGFHEEQLCERLANGFIRAKYGEK